MTTATRAKRGSALTELETLEADLARATAAHRDVGRRHKEAQDALRELLERRTRLLNRQPGQFRHDGSPLTDDNEAAEIQRAIDALGQTNYSSEIAHAARLEQAAKDAAMSHIAANFDVLVEALQPDAEAAVAVVQERAAALADAADAYLGLAKRVDGLRAADRRLARVRVPAIDPGAELVRVVAGYRDMALPLPTELRYPGQP